MPTKKKTDPLVRDMKEAKNATKLGRSFAKASRKPVTDEAANPKDPKRKPMPKKQQRRARLTAGKLAAKNLMAGAAAKGRLKAGTSGQKKTKKKKRK